MISLQAIYGDKLFHRNHTYKFSWLVGGLSSIIINIIAA